MKRRRFRRWAKWACTCTLVMLLIVTVLSRWWTPEWWSVSADGLDVSSIRVQGSVLWISESLRGSFVYSHPIGWHLERTYEWTWGFVEDPSQAGGLWAWHYGYLSCRPYPWCRSWGFSLVYPIVLAAIPTVLLWYADRRRAGACNACGYDRAGLSAEAPCPECGQAPTN